MQRFTHGNYASGLSVKLDSSGNVYVLTANSQADSTNGDYCLLKYSNSGTLLWNVYYNSPGNLSDQPVAFVVTATGDIYITGHTSINFAQHITTVKFNSTGVLQWARVYNGGWQSDDANDIALDKSGNIIICGGSLVSNSLSVGLVIKYNSNGDSVWVKKYNPSQQHNYLSKLVIDDSGNVYTAGYFDFGNQTDYLIVKYSSSGNLVWHTTYDSPQHYNDGADHLALDINRNIYVIGTNAVPSSLANNTLVKLNGNGLIQWARVFTGILDTEGGCETPGGLAVSSDGNAIYYSAECANSQGNGVIVTLKYNSTGDSNWVRRYSQGNTDGIPTIGPTLKSKYTTVN